MAVTIHIDKELGGIDGDEIVIGHQFELAAVIYGNNSHFLALLIKDSQSLWLYDGQRNEGDFETYTPPPTSCLLGNPHNSTYRRFPHNLPDNENLSHRGYTANTLVYKRKTA